MAALFDLEIHTPYRLFFSGQVEATILTIEDGEICVYANHSLLTAPIVDCIISMKDEDGKWRSAFISKGILEIKSRKNVIIVDTAEWPEEIDRERAARAKKQAEADLSIAHLKFEVDNAKAKLRRSECRLKVTEGKTVTN